MTGLRTIDLPQREEANELLTLEEEDVSLMAVMDDAAEVVREVVECHATLRRKLGIAP